MWVSESNTHLPMHARRGATWVCVMLQHGECHASTCVRTGLQDACTSPCRHSARINTRWKNEIFRAGCVKYHAHRADVGNWAVLGMGNAYIWNLSHFCLVFGTPPLLSLVFVTLSVIYLCFLSRIQWVFVTVLFAFCHVYAVHLSVFQSVARLYILYICLFNLKRKDLSFFSLKKRMLSYL